MPPIESIPHTLQKISIHALREEGDDFLYQHQRCRPNFNPRPPRGGRLNCYKVLPITTLFQSTPSARRATVLATLSYITDFHFNPRPPRGGRHRPYLTAKSMHRISIHALREEGDGRQETQQPAKFYFNPRPPRGGRPVIFACGRCPVLISIHALREEGDITAGNRSAAHLYFNPRPPRGGRLFPDTTIAQEVQFQSTPSARRAT